MSVPFAKLEAMTRELCESRRGKGAYDRRYCKRAHWRKRAAARYEIIKRNPIAISLFRACGWKIQL